MLKNWNSKTKILLKCRYNLGRGPMATHDLPPEAANWPLDCGTKRKNLKKVHGKGEFVSVQAVHVVRTWCPYKQGPQWATTIENMLCICRSPDGMYLLSSHDDSTLRLFLAPTLTHKNPENSHESFKILASTLSEESENVLRPVYIFREAESVTDYAWYPPFNYQGKSPASDPHMCLLAYFVLTFWCLDLGSCCFASATKDHPVRLWDIPTGRVHFSMFG